MSSDGGDEFYIVRGTSSQGPFTAAELSVLISTGELRARDQIKVQGSIFSFPAVALPFFAKSTGHFHEWLWSISKNPDRRGKALLFAAIPLAVVAVILGIGLFPSGTYPRILLVAPGLLVGSALAYVFGFIVFHIPEALGLALSVIVGLASTLLLILLVKILWS